MRAGGDLGPGPGVAVRHPRCLVAQALQGFQFRFHPVFAALNRPLKNTKLLHDKRGGFQGLGGVSLSMLDNKVSLIFNTLQVSTEPDFCKNVAV